MRLSERVVTTKACSRPGQPTDVQRYDFAGDVVAAATSNPI
jgi:hypothetical protein